MVANDPLVAGPMGALAARLTALERKVDNNQRQRPLGFFYDTFGNEVFAPDPLGGLSKPWLSIPLMCLFDDGTVLGATSNRTHASFYGATQLLQGQIATPQLVWTGLIPQVTHPFLAVCGLFGYTTNPNTITADFQLNGTSVGTVASDTLIAPQTPASMYGPWDISDLLGQQAVTVNVFASSTQLQGSADLVACAIQCLVLRGSQ